MAGKLARGQALALLSDVERRHEASRLSDYAVPLWLTLSPLVLSYVEVALFLFMGWLYSEGMESEAFSAFYVLAAVSLADLFLGLYAHYRLIDRRNRHFKRVHSLYRVVELLEGLGSDRARAMRVMVGDMEAEEGERSAVVWTLAAVLTGVAAIYVYHFLNKDFHRHSAREKALLWEVRRAITELGGVTVFSPEDLDVVPNRSTLLYLLLTVITLGLFGLYWLYTLTRDPNEHFKCHSLVEGAMVSDLRNLVEKVIPEEGP